MLSEIFINENVKIPSYRVTRVTDVQSIICNLCKNILTLSDSKLCSACNKKFCSVCAKDEVSHKCKSTFLLNFEESFYENLSNVLILCKNEENGCKEIKKYTELFCHEIICLYELKICNDCNKKFVKKEIDSHNKTCNAKLLCIFQNKLKTSFTQIKNLNILLENNKDIISDKFQLLDDYFMKSEKLNKKMLAFFKKDLQNPNLMTSTPLDDMLIISIKNNSSFLTPLASNLFLDYSLKNQSQIKTDMIRFIVKLNDENFAIGEHNGTISILEIKSFKFKSVLYQLGTLMDLIVINDERFVTSCGLKLFIWDSKNFHILKEFNNKNTLICKFNNNSFACFSIKSMAVYDVNEGLPISKANLESEPKTGFQLNCNELIFLTKDFNIIIWNIQSNEINKTISLFHNKPIKIVKLTYEDIFIFYNHSPGLMIFNIKTEQIKKIYDFKVTKVVFIPDKYALLSIVPYFAVLDLLSETIIKKIEINTFKKIEIIDKESMITMQEGLINLYGK